MHHYEIIVSGSTVLMLRNPHDVALPMDTQKAKSRVLIHSHHWRLP